MHIEEGTVAVVTGAASGIGRACALEFARRGADVVVADVNEERSGEVTSAIESLGRRALAVRCDVSSDRDVERLRDRSLEAMGHVDLLMNNAGVVLMGPPERIPIDDWRWILDINLLGLIRGVQAFAPHLEERGSGHVVNTASVAGLYAYSWDAIPYITSKFGAYGFSEALYAYLKPQGIGVTVLCPGLVATNLGEHARYAGLEDPSGWVHLPQDMVELTIEPEGIGPMVADAVEEDRFLVLTNPEYADKLAKRRADIDAALAEQVASAPRPPSLA